MALSLAAHSRLLARLNKVFFCRTISTAKVVSGTQLVSSVKESRYPQHIYCSLFNHSELPSPRFDPSEDFNVFDDECKEFEDVPMYPMPSNEDAAIKKPTPSDRMTKLLDEFVERLDTDLRLELQHFKPYLIKSGLYKQSPYLLDPLTCGESNCQTSYLTNIAIIVHFIFVSIFSDELCKMIGDIRNPDTAVILRDSGPGVLSTQLLKHEAQRLHLIEHRQHFKRYLEVRKSYQKDGDFSDLNGYFY